MVAVMLAVVSAVFAVYIVVLMVSHYRREQHWQEIFRARIVDHDAFVVRQMASVERVRARQSYMAGRIVQMQGVSEEAQTLVKNMVAAWAAETETASCVELPCSGECPVVDSPV